MKVRVIEVGPRDGLQNEATPISTELKIAFIERLAAAGLNEIEATSFVSPKWVPQLGDASELWPQLPPGPLYSALVPNMRGLESALAVGVERIAVFTATSDAFTIKNINMTVEQSLAVQAEVISAFRAPSLSERSDDGEGVGGGVTDLPLSPMNGGERGLGGEGRFVRGYVSTAFECPYAGKVDPERTVEVAIQLIEMGCDEVSIGDTIGVAVPAEVRLLTQMLVAAIPKERLVYHFHDTRGTAIANVAEALEQGIGAFDSSAAGLGGCPYAKGAGGNLATEDLAYFLERSGLLTGLDLPRLAQASLPVLQALGRAPFAKAQQALLASDG